MSWTRFSKTELLFWLLLGVAVIALNVWHYNGPFISNDGIQYLSVAKNIAAGRGIRTSIVHYDEERTHTEIPAPSTTFPPGYSSTVALLSMTGLSVEWAGLLVSAFAFLALVPLICRLAAWLELSAMATRFVLLALVVNYIASIQSSKTESESLFTLLTMGAVICLLDCAAQVQASVAKRAELAWRAWSFAGILIGLAYWVRYAGLFLFAAAMLLAAAAVFLLPRRHAAKPLTTIAIAASMIALLFWRNIANTGSWKGGNTKDVFNPLLGFLKTAAGTAYQLVLGNLVRDRLGLLEAAFAVGALAVAVVVLLKLAPNVRAIRPSSRVLTTLIVIVTFSGVYTAAFIYLGLFSVISFSAKMFYPIFPLLLLLLAWVLSETWKRVPRPSWQRTAFAAGLAMALLSYCAVNVRDILGSQATRFSSILEFRRVAGRFEAPTPRGEPLRSWVEENIPAGDPIVASDGQSTAYALQREAVSLVSSEYSDHVWNEAAIRQVMDSFHSEVLILYPNTTAESNPVQVESEFLSGLLHGEMPSWLTLAAENAEVKIFRRVDAPPQSARTLSGSPAP